MNNPPMTEHEINEQIWKELSTLERYDGGKRHRFSLGLPIYYSDDDTPDGLTIREYPDGRRELIRRHSEGEEIVRVLSASLR